jgi:hypothetical protein
MSGIKFDQGKPDMSLLPHDSLIEIAKVMDFGKQKYSAHNWKNEIEWSRVLAAAYRHMGEFNEGRRVDSETGLSHLAHAATNLLFLLWYEKNRGAKDDLYKPQTEDKEST